MGIFAAAPFAGMLIAASTAAASMPIKSVPMRTLHEARPLSAWTAFCDGPGKNECAIDFAQPKRFALTDSVWKAVLAINTTVNRTVKHVTDQEHWGAPDVWTLAEDGKGDTEDYALLKRKLLVGRGLPRRAMRMTIVMDGKGEGHALLTLITDSGDFILDNETNAVLPWHDTGYVFIKRESQDSIGWVSLGGATSPSDYDKKLDPKSAVTIAPPK